MTNRHKINIIFDDPVFENVPNECFETKDGKKIWKSRNVAVSVKIVSRDNHYLLVKRGRKATHASLYCFPCGYLDWNETVSQAAIREVYEETGLLFKEEDLIFEGIDSDPCKFGQNVSVMFRINTGDYSIRSGFEPDKNEVAGMGWFPPFALPEMAFDHKERILADAR